MPVPKNKSTAPTLSPAKTAPAVLQETATRSRTPKSGSTLSESQPAKRKADDDAVLDLENKKKFEAEFLPTVEIICEPFIGSALSRLSTNLPPSQAPRRSMADYSTVLEPDESAKANVCSEKSILLRFKAAIFTAINTCDKSFKSLTWVNKINPMVPLCPFELDGVCNDRTCIYQHLSQYKPSATETLKASQLLFHLLLLIYSDSGILFLRC